MGQSGFTLVELLTVLLIMGILLAIAVPSFGALRARSYDARAQANIRGAWPALELYFEANQTYVGMSTATLRAIDAGIPAALDFQDLTATSYCIDDDSVIGSEYRKNGPAAPIEPGTC